jgi:hypothetical protein
MKKHFTRRIDMGKVIHARKTEKDELQFRVWSTNTDSYITEEMTEAELREWTLKKAVCDAIEQHLREIDSRIQRTTENGTSSRIGDTRVITAPWDEERG